MSPKAKLPYIEALVVLHGKDSQVDLDPLGRTRVLALDGYHVKGGLPLLSEFLAEPPDNSHHAIDLTAATAARKARRGPSASSSGRRTLPEGSPADRAAWGSLRRCSPTAANRQPGDPHANRHVRRLTVSVAASSQGVRLPAPLLHRPPDPADPASWSGSYTGRAFERLGGGGDSPGTRHAFTSADLLAVQTLSVQVPAEVSIQILHGRVGRRLNRLLEEIPTDVARGEEEAENHIHAEAPASLAWATLTELPGVGWVTAGKLLARKRPHLIPVYDEVVRCALGSPESLWTALHKALRAHRADLGERLRRLRAEAAVPSEVSDLRVIDVVVWMAHRRVHAPRGCSLPGMSALS